MRFLQARGFWVSLLAVLGIVLLASPASATLSEALSLAELVQRADTVALVTCTDQRARRDDRNRIVTDYELRLDEVMRGAAASGATVTMRRLGGELGDIGMIIEGEPRMVPGDRYLVFLHEVHGRLRPVGMSQGVLPVDEQEGTLTVHPGGHGMALVQRGANGQLVPAPAALLHPEPYDRLRERVQGLVDAP